MFSPYSPPTCGSFSSISSVEMSIVPTASFVGNPICAFPSWPRRSSLTDLDCSTENINANSFLSYEDLLLDESPFDDDIGPALSLSSSSGNDATSPSNRRAEARNAPVTDEQLQALIRRRQQQENEMTRLVELAERERRRKQAALAAAAAAASNKKSKQRRGSSKKMKNKPKVLTTIPEAGE